VAVDLTTRTLGRCNFTPRRGTSAQQKARPAELSEQQGGLRRRFRP
jgi:hypothetical protein